MLVVQSKALLVQILPIVEAISFHHPHGMVSANKNLIQRKLRPFKSGYEIANKILMVGIDID